MHHSTEKIVPTNIFSMPDSNIYNNQTVLQCNAIGIIFY